VTVQNNTVHTAIVLQVRGRAGAYEYGVLKALYEKRPGFTSRRGHRHLDRCGHRGGARRCKGDPMKALDTMWREKFTVSAVCRSPGAGPVPGRAGRLRHVPLRHQPFDAVGAGPVDVDEHLRHRALADDAGRTGGPGKAQRRTPPVVVGATNIGTAEIEFFDNRARRPHLRTHRRQRQPSPGIPDDQHRR